MVVAVNALGTLLAFVLQIVLARSLDAASFGVYSYVLAWITMFVFVAKFGLDTAALRFIPEYIAQNRWSEVRGFIRASTFWALGLSVAVGCILAALAMSAGVTLGLEPEAAFLVAGITVPVNAYLIMQGAYLQAFRLIVSSQAPQVVLRPIFLACAVLILSRLCGIDLNAVDVLWLNIASIMAGMFVMHWLQRRYFPKEVSAGGRTYLNAEWLKVAYPMLLVTGFNMMLNQVDIIMVGMLRDPVEVGVYSVASRLSLLVPFGLLVVNSIVAPMISRMYSNRELIGLQNVLTKAAWAGLLLSVPVVAVFVLASDRVMLYFGSQFLAGAGTLAVLAASRFVVALSGASGYLLSMTGHQKQAAYIMGATVVINIALNWWWIPVFGMFGAALSSVLSSLLWCVAMIVSGRVLVGLDASVFRIGGVRDAE